MATAALTDFTKNRPIPEKPSDPTICPFCGGKDVKEEGNRMTLVAQSGKVTPDNDVNHVWRYCACCRGVPGCGKKFTRESKSGQVWYTERIGGEDWLLKGVPGCFERYVFACAACGGAVRREHRQMDGVTPTESCVHEIKDGKSIRHFRTFWRCAGCGAVHETEEWVVGQFDRK